MKLYHFVFNQWYHMVDCNESASQWPLQHHKSVPKGTSFPGHHDNPLFNLDRRPSKKYQPMRSFPFFFSCGRLLPFAPWVVERVLWTRKISPRRLFTSKLSMQFAFSMSANSFQIKILIFKSKERHPRPVQLWGPTFATHESMPRMDIRPETKGAYAPKASLPSEVEEHSHIINYQRAHITWTTSLIIFFPPFLPTNLTLMIRPVLHTRMASEASRMVGVHGPTPHRGLGL